MSFKYDLKLIVPVGSDPSISDDEVASKKVKKSLSSNHNDTARSVVIEGYISKFLHKHNNIARRYIVMNSHAIFVYKDDTAYKSSPKRPSEFIPFGEIASINQREFDTRFLLKNPGSSSLRENETVFGLEIALKRSYG